MDVTRQKSHASTAQISNPDLHPNLAKIRHVALDLDGTIYKGGTLFPFTLSFLKLLAQLNIGHTFLTNNSSKSPRDYLAHLRRMGIDATREQIYTSADSTILYLHENYANVRRIFVLGTESLQQQFREAGFEVLPDDTSPKLVIVGYDPNLPHDRLCKAAWWVKNGIPYIATHPDRICPTDQPTLLVDCGAICACIESATGIAPAAILGKPDPIMLRGIMQRHKLSPNELAMVGDRLYTDMEMARRSGAVSVLVLSGETTAEQARQHREQLDFTLASIESLGEMLQSCHSAGNAM